jgi:hypothetical protein
MSEWLSVDNELPVSLDGTPSYDYVLVSDGDAKFSIARYAHKNVDKVLIPTWEFLATYETGEGVSAYAGDIETDMSVDEIKYWMEFPEPPIAKKIRTRNASASMSITTLYHYTTEDDA